MFRNKVVIVTGASRGIGKAIAIKFARNGAKVIAMYKNSDKEIETLMNNNFCGEIYPYKVDISKCNELESVINDIVKHHKRIDVLVNNAGIVYDRDFENIKLYEFEKTLKTNVIAPFELSRLSSKYMSHGSSIINISSTNGTKTVSPECLDYNISKIGLQSLTRDLAFQFKPNIRVNAIAIGWADTDMNKDLPEDYIQSEIQKIYLARFAQPSEIANIVAFLASEESFYINGEIINVDGGM